MLRRLKTGAGRGLTVEISGRFPTPFGGERVYLAKYDALLRAAGTEARTEAQGQIEGSFAALRFAQDDGGETGSAKATAKANTGVFRAAALCSG